MNMSKVLKKKRKTVVAEVSLSSPLWVLCHSDWRCGSGLRVLPSLYAASNVEGGQRREGQLGTLT